MSDLVCDKHQWNGSFIQQRCPLCKIAEERDGARLNWMESRQYVEATNTEDEDGEERPGLIWLIHTGKSLRSAIDEAMKRGEQNG